MLLYWHNWHYDCIGARESRKHKFMLNCNNHLFQVWTCLLTESRHYRPTLALCVSCATSTLPATSSRSFQTTRWKFSHPFRYERDFSYQIAFSSGSSKSAKLRQIRLPFLQFYNLNCRPILYVICLLYFVLFHYFYILCCLSCCRNKVVFEFL